MPNKPISQFSDNPAPSLADYYPIDHNNVTYKITLGAVKNLFGIDSKLDTNIFSAFTSTTLTIPIFSAYTANTLSILNNKVDLNVYSAFTSTTLTIPIFSSYTSNTQTILNSKLSTVIHDNTLTGSGTTGSPLSVVNWNNFNKGITGGTYSAGTLSLSNSTGGTINISGFTSGQLFPNGIEFVNSSRDWSASDAGKLIVLDGGSINITMPTINPFNAGDNIGVITNNANSGFQTENGGDIIYPLTNESGEVVLLTNILVGPDVFMTLVSGGAVTDGPAKKTYLKYLYDKVSNIGIFPNGVEFVTSSRDWLASDAGKLIIGDGSNIELTMPLVNPFSIGDNIGFITTNQNTGFNTRAGEYIIYPSVIGGSGNGSGEIVLLTNVNVSGDITMLGVSTQFVQGDVTQKTILKYLYDNVNSGLFPNGVEIVASNRDYQVSDAGKILILGDDIEITMPNINPFSIGDIIGLGSLTNNLNCAFQLDNSGPLIYPLTQDYQELVVITNVDVFGSTRTRLLSSGYLNDTNDSRFKTHSRYFYDNINTSSGVTISSGNGVQVISGMTNLGDLTGNLFLNANGNSYRMGGLSAYQIACGGIMNISSQRINLSSFGDNINIVADNNNKVNITAGSGVGGSINFNANGGDGVFLKGELINNNISYLLGSTDYSEGKLKWLDVNSIKLIKKIDTTVIDHLVGPDEYIISCQNGVNNIFVTLPDASTNIGRIVIIKRKDDTSIGLITVNSLSGNIQDLSSGAFISSVNISIWGQPGQCQTFISNGANWEILN